MDELENKSDNKTTSAVSASTASQNSANVPNGLPKEAPKPATQANQSDGASVPALGTNQPSASSDQPSGAAHSGRNSVTTLLPTEVEEDTGGCLAMVLETQVQNFLS